MAGFSKSTWQGFFSSTPTVRKLPTRSFVDAHLTGVHDRVRHLRHLRAIQEAMEILKDEEVAHPARNPEISGVLGDPFAGRGGLTDIFGNAIDIGHTGDSLRDEYGPGHMPGEHNNDPGDPRGSWRLGMARQDDSSEEDEYEDKWVRAFDSATEVLQSLVDFCTTLKKQEEAATELAAKLWRNGATWAYDALLRVEPQRKENRRYIQYCEKAVQEGKDYFRWRFNVDPPIKKPRPDDGGTPRPTPRDRLAIQEALAELEQWGDPSSDFELQQIERRHLTAEAVQALWEFRRGGNPAVFDRLGNLEKQRRMADGALRGILYQLRINHPAINWGEAGPPPPPRARHAGWGETNQAAAGSRSPRMSEND